MLSLQKLSDVIISGDYEKSKHITQKLIEQGINAIDILNKGLSAGMEVVGQRFKADELYIPEVLMSARAMQDAMDVLEPILLKEKADKKVITIVLGSVRGDIHTIGKNLVGMMLESVGYNVIDIGFDVPNDKFVEFAKNNNAKIVGLSALLTTTMSVMKDVINTLKIDSETKTVKVIVGGAPVTQEYADSIGADGYAYDAISAIELVKKLLDNFN